MSFWVVKKNPETQVEVESPYLEVVFQKRPLFNKAPWMLYLSNISPVGFPFLHTRVYILSDKSYTGIMEGIENNTYFY